MDTTEYIFRDCTSLISSLIRERIIHLSQPYPHPVCVFASVFTVTKTCNIHIFLSFLFRTVMWYCCHEFRKLEKSPRYQRPRLNFRVERIKLKLISKQTTSSCLDCIILFRISEILRSCYTDIWYFLRNEMITKI